MLLFSVGAASIVLCTLVAGQDEVYSTWMADSFLLKNLTNGRDYQASVMYRAVEMVFDNTGNETYLDWVFDHVAAVVSDNGTLSDYPSTVDALDDIRFGNVMLDLYFRTNETKYLTAAKTLRHQLDTHNRTASGGFWHKSIYPNQMWLDGLYMADVFYAHYTAAFEPDNTTAWDDIILQFTLIEEHCRNATTNLLKHGYDESHVAVWADPVTGASPHVWIRALGWYMMALLDTLDVFPQTHSGYQKLLDWYTSLAGAVVANQDETGGWWLVMDEPYPGMEGNYIESSGTAMFTYGLLKGAKLGYVAAEDVVQPALDAYNLMLTDFVAHNATGGMLNWEGTVRVGSLDTDGSYEYYISVPIDENDLKGAGPFIYASLLVEELND